MQQLKLDAAAGISEAGGQSHVQQREKNNHYYVLQCCTNYQTMCKEANGDASATGTEESCWDGHPPMQSI